MSLLQTGKHLIGSLLSLWWTCVSNCVLIPIFIMWRAIAHCCEFIDCVRQKVSQISEVPTKLFGIWHGFVRKIKTLLEAPELNRQRLLHENAIHLSHARASAAGNTEEITENEKVLILMQKMRKLQETIFQQSVDRRKAEGELFELKVNYQQKNAQLIKQRSQCVENLNKINVLKAELNEKNDIMEKNKKRMEELEQELLNAKQEIAKIHEQKVETENNVNEKDQNKQDESSEAESSQHKEPVNSTVERQSKPQTQ